MDRSFRTDLFLCPARQRIFILDCQPKARVVQAREAREASLGLVCDGADVAGLARDRTKGLLGEGWQTDGTGVLSARHTQSAGASGGMVTGARASDTEVAVAGGLVGVPVVHRAVHGAIGQVTIAGVVQGLLRRSLGLAEASQDHGV